MRLYWPKQEALISFTALALRSSIKSTNLVGTLAAPAWKVVTTQAPLGRTAAVNTS
jgi:hypothetical protein